ncbi:MAG: carboxypeptidase regulatory-like domain-containing protein, partial [Acidobacteriota bacterium]
KIQDVGGYFGGAVAVDNDTIVASAPSVNKVYIYRRSGTGWTSTWGLEATITPPAGTSGSWFGGSVAVDGNLLAIGAPDFIVNTTASQGQVFIYERSGTTWTLAETINVPNADSGQTISFGGSVSLNQTTLVVGGPMYSTQTGVAYVYVENAGTWTLEQRMQGTQQNEYFGSSVAVNGDNLLIGSPFKDRNNGTIVDTGEIGYWTRSMGTWTAQQVIYTNVANTLFGNSVAITTNGLSIGGLKGFNNNAGAVCPFTANLGTWQGGACYASPDPEGSAEFGYSVGISGTKAVVGEPYKTVGGNAYQGRIHTYDLASGFTLVRSMSSVGGLQDESLGEAVAVDGDTMVAGAPGYLQVNHPYNQLGGATDGALFVFQDYTTTAAGAVVSGRVRTSNGAGLKNAKVTLTDSQGTTRTVSTGSFGSFRFENIPVGQDYVLTVGSKRYRFSPQTISLTADLTGLEITAGR